MAYVSDFRLNFRFVDSNGESGQIVMNWSGAQHGDQLTGSFAHHDAVSLAYRNWVEKETGLRPPKAVVDVRIKVLPHDEVFLTILVDDVGDGCGHYAMTGHAQVENATNATPSGYVRRYPMKRGA